MKTQDLPALLTVGNLRFARNGSALVDTLFSLGGTASGLFKVRKHSALFMRPDGSPFACLVANPGQSKFFVSCSLVPQAAGKPVLHYMYALSDADAVALGISALKFSAQSDEADRVWRVLNAVQEEAK